VFPERACVVSGNVILAGKTLLDAEEAGGGAIAVGPTVFSPTDVAVILVNSGEVRSAALGASDEGFRSLAVGDGMSEAEAAAALDESGTVFERLDSGLTTKEVRWGTAHEFKAVPIRVIEGKNNARMDFGSKVFLAT
jgi:hypothetical protein